MIVGNGRTVFVILLSDPGSIDRRNTGGGVATARSFNTCGSPIEHISVYVRDRVQGRRESCYFIALPEPIGGIR